MIRLWEIFQRGLAVVLIVPALGIAIIVGIIICVISPGPIFIRQAREGLYGVPFEFYKIRTMFLNAHEILEKCLSESSLVREEWENYGCLRKDPRVAGKIALFARHSSIDELPQLINVIKGDMNLVKPRPLPLDIVTKMNELDRIKRQTVKPGITGLWQVSGRSELNIMQIGQIDCNYVDKRSVLFDMYIILKTFRVVIIGRGAY